MIHNEHVSAICCRPEVDDDVISGWNEKIIEGYVVVGPNFEVASFRSFRHFPQDHFMTVKLATAAVAWTRFAADWK